MNRSIAIVGAPMSIGIRTYDSGEPRHLDRAPGVLRKLGLAQRLGASDLGHVIPNSSGRAPIVCFTVWPSRYSMAASRRYSPF